MSGNLDRVLKKSNKKTKAAALEVKVFEYLLICVLLRTQPFAKASRAA